MVNINIPNKQLGTPGRIRGIDGGKGGARTLIGGKNKGLQGRREELSWDFLANRFTPNYIQRKQFFPRTKEEDKNHRNSVLAGDGLLQPTKITGEMERRKRVSRGIGSEEDIKILVD